MCSLTLLATMILAATPASALEYAEADAAAGSFGKSTSVEPATVIGGVNIYEADVSKNSALIPPDFGTPRADLPGSGELLTPNLASGGATAPLVGAGGVTVLPPSTGGGSIGGIVPATGYTAVTGNLYYSAGHLGTLKIPAIGLTVKVYQGTDSTALRKGAGHFESTSIWDGNVAFAGHNRGVNDNFGKIHTLDTGDTIKLTTKLGTRSYSVYSVRKVSVNDVSVLDSTGENIVTLVTCVMNQPDYRWCVQARQK